MQNPELRGLDQILALVDNGSYHPLLLQDLGGLVAEMKDFSNAFGGAKAKGKLVLTIDLTTDRFGQIDLEVQHKVTAPKPPKAKGTAWTTDDGGLTPANPMQTRMEIRDVSPGRAEFRVPGANQD
jgi:hypothetical protein